MSATYYRSIAATLDRVAEDVVGCDTGTILPCRQRLPDVLRGAATDFLTQELDDCSADLAVAVSILTAGAAAARARAAEIEAAEAAAAAAAAESDDEPPVDEPPVVLPFF